MSNAVVTEPAVEGALNFVNGFFSKLPLDGTKYKTEWTKILAGTAFDAGTRSFTFILPKLQYPYSYEIHETLASVKVRILDVATGKVPTKEKHVAGINNMLLSLFSTVKLSINDQLISDSPDNYNLNAYFQTLLTFNRDVKENGTLTACGFGYDAEDFISFSTNPCFRQRELFFRKGRLLSGDYHDEGAHLIGRLLHDLSTAEKGLPPNTRVQFEFNLVDDDLWIEKRPESLTSPTDTSKYKYEIIDFCLFVPVATLSERVCEDLLRRWAKEDIIYHYRRFAVTRWSIPKSNDSFSHSIFVGSNPTRVYLCVQETKNTTGKQSSSPYFFMRSWDYEVNLGNAQSNSQEEIIAARVQREVNLALSRLNLPAPGNSTPSTSRGRGRGASRSSRTRQGQGQGLLSAVGNFFNREAEEASVAESTDSGADSEQSSVNDRPISRPVLTATKTIYLTKLQLEFNSTEVDQLNSQITEHNCTQDYIRTCQTNQFLGTLYDNSVSLGKFNKGFFINGFDLTCAGSGGALPFATALVRKGDIRVHVTTSESIPSSLNLEVVVFGEFIQTLKLSASGKIDKSFSEN